VNLGKLKRQLVRDLKGSPKKAAFLGLALLVAAWFWAPLVGKWFKGKEDPAEAAAVAAAGTTAPLAEVAQASAAAAASTPQPTSWRRVLEWIEADPRTAPPVHPTIAINPLRSLIEQDETDSEEAADDPDASAEAPAPAEAEEQPAVTPQQAGLVLSGTLIGTRRRVAMIGGRPYSEGQTIELPAAAFRVARIGHKHVVLEREGERFELRVARPEGAGAMGLAPAEE
jgi:hypothetical protein